jgi:pyruvate dehydrogenase phosphatase
MAVLDTAHRDLYVSCTGDSRAVAGVWEETPDGQGCWRVEVLSEDQTGRNPEEVQRLVFLTSEYSRSGLLSQIHSIQSEHPAEESPFVIQRGRVLGSLEPTCALSY